MNIKKSFAGILTLLLSFPVTGLPYSDTADSESHIYEPENVFFLLSDIDVTTPSRTKISLRKAPGTVSVLTDRDIERMGATSVTEALRSMPEVTMRRVTMGDEIGIRAFGRSPFTERVLLLIDGAPYNSPDKGDFPTLPMYDLFPLAAVKQIEVISGPGSAMYGANAFWGVVNIVTKKGRDYGNGGNLAFNSGARNTIQETAAFGHSEEGKEMSFVSSHKQEKGPVDWLKTSAMKYDNVYANAGGQNFSVSYYLHRDDSTPVPWTATTFNIGTHQSINIGDISYKKEFTDNFGISSKLFYNRRKGNTCASCHGTKLLPDETNERKFANLQANLKFYNHKLAGGIEISDDHIRKEADIVKPNPNTDLSNFAGYIEDQSGFYADKLIMTAGIRYDANEKFSNTFSPRVSLVYAPDEKLVIRTGYSRAFRKPTWNELYLNYVIKGNPDLDNETIKAFEAGTEYRFTNHLTGKLDLYQNRIERYIYYFFGVAGTSNIANDTGHVNTYGNEIKLTWSPSAKTMTFLGYAVERFDFRKSAITPNFPVYAPENKITGGLSLTPCHRCTLDTSLSYYDQALAPNITSVAGAQSVFLADTRFSYYFPVGTSRLKFVLNGKNLFNRKINQHQSGGFTTFRKAIWPGREFFTQITWEF